MSASSCITAVAPTAIVTVAPMATFVTAPLPLLMVLRSTPPASKTSTPMSTVVLDVPVFVHMTIGCTPLAFVIAGITATRMAGRPTAAGGMGGKTGSGVSITPAWTNCGRRANRTSPSATNRTHRFIVRQCTYHVPPPYGQTHTATRTPCMPS